jgi:hypothetical protein
VFGIVLCIVSPFVYSFLFPTFEQIYRSLPLGGNIIAANKYHNVSQKQLYKWSLLPGIFFRITLFDHLLRPGVFKIQ